MTESPAFRTFTGGELQTNAYVVECPTGPILFDAPEGVLSWLTASGIAPKLLLLTHGHFDHVLGAAAVVREFGCAVGCHTLDLEMVTSRNFYAKWGVPIALDPIAPTVDLDHEGETTFSGAKVHLYHVPGHSPGSVAFYLPEWGLLVGGDVLFAGGIGRWDLPGGNGALLVQNIKQKLFPLPQETVVLPGHGPTTTLLRERETNPFLID